MADSSPNLVVWLTGLPASGKSTLANLLAADLRSRGYLVEVLDGDVVRKAQNRDLGYSLEDRTENVRRVAQQAEHFALSGIIVICALISPRRLHRSLARQICRAHIFQEVYLCADAATCAARDPKGNYCRALAGQITHFTGISDPYEVPEDADLVVDTVTRSARNSLEQIKNHLAKSGLIY